MSAAVGDGLGENHALRLYCLMHSKGLGNSWPKFMRTMALY